MSIVALAGGVGGAKLVYGLDNTLVPGDLSVVVNTGDDFYHYGLKICPDIDTVCYTLAGIANPVTGWGIDQDKWNALEMVSKLGGETWFKLGDKDLGLHLERTRRFRSGESLTQITHDICEKLNIRTDIYPMTDDDAPTYIETYSHGRLPFQEYFVKYQCEPGVINIDLSSALVAKAQFKVIEKIRHSEAVILCPSNPLVSIGPIISVPEISKALMEHPNVLAVSPIIGGSTVKGPAAKMYKEMGIEPSALSVAKHYQPLLKYFMIDNRDRILKKEIENLGIIPIVSDILMNDNNDRIRLAKEIILVARRSV